MTDLTPIYDAIRKADAAGDADSVKKLGAYLASAKSESTEKAQPWKRPEGWKSAAELDQRPGHLPVTAKSDYSSSFEDTKKSYRSAMQGALKGEAHGVADPLIGIGQTVAHVLGAGEAADKLVQDREAKIAAQRGGDTGVDAWRTAGNVMSPVNYLGPAGPAGAGVGNALGRIGVAAGTGAAVNAMQPVASGDFWTEKAKQAGVGAAAGGVLGTAGEVVSKALQPLGAAAARGVDSIKRFLGQQMPSSLQSAAVHKVLESFGRDEAAGGPKLTEVFDVLDAAHKAGKPMTLADVGGSDVKAMTGYLSRQPGESGSRVNQFLDERDATVPSRLHGDITKYVSSGDSLKQTADALTQSRAAAARPLYEEAMKPGSAAPLKDTFEAEFGRIQSERAAAQQAISQAERGVDRTAARAAQAGQTGERSPLSTEARSAAAQGMEQARAKLASLDAQEAKVTAVMREAQRASAAGERGGVWSPRVQQFLDDPIIKQGISKGMKVQRLEALAEGREFNPKDFAVTIGKDGEPIVGQVPNMRLLDSAKRGLDEILEGYRDKTTGRLVLDQQGRAIDQVRQSFIKELDRLNPSYATARASWAGPSQSLDAMQRGRDLLKSSPEEIAAMMKRASPNEKEFMRLGLADRLRQSVDSTRFAGDESKALINSQRAKDQLRAAFDDPKEADKFIDAVLSERKMFDTNVHIRGNSATARRVSEDKAMSADMDALTSAAKAGVHILGHNPFGAVREMLQVNRALGWRKNQALNAEIARLLTDPTIGRNALQSQAGVRLLNSFPGPATRNYLQQGFTDAVRAAAPAAALLTNQGINQ